jgi:hypothetical protein
MIIESLFLDSKAEFFFKIICFIYILWLNNDHLINVRQNVRKIYKDQTKFEINV